MSVSASQPLQGGVGVDRTTEFCSKNLLLCAWCVTLGGLSWCPGLFPVLVVDPQTLGMKQPSGNSSLLAPLPPVPQGSVSRDFSLSELLLGGIYGAALREKDLGQTCM